MHSNTDMRGANIPQTQEWEDLVRLVMGSGVYKNTGSFQKRFSKVINVKGFASAYSLVLHIPKIFTDWLLGNLCRRGCV